MIYLELFLTFLQIGAVSFGGGYAMISLIREQVLSHNWLSESDFLNMVIFVFLDDFFFFILPPDSF